MSKASPPLRSSTESEKREDLWIHRQGRGLSEKVLARLARSTELEGLSATTSALVFSVYFQSELCPLLILCATNRQADELAADFRFFLPPSLQEEILLFPAIETDPYRGLSPHPDVAAKRAAALARLGQGFQGITIAPLAALLQKIVAPERFQEGCRILSLGDEISRDDLILDLRAIGYVREDPVSDIGEFSYRGGIVDFFPPSHRHPVRLEFFGDSIESIREFDPSTQRSVDLITECRLVPMRELTPTAEEIEEWNREAPETWKEVRFAQTLQEHFEFTRNGELFNGFEYLFPLVVPSDATLIDYLPRRPDTVFALVESEQLWSAAEERQERLEESFQDADLEGSAALPPKELFLSPDRLRSLLDHELTYKLARWTTKEEGTEQERFDFRPEQKFQGRIQDLLAACADWKEKGDQVILALPSEGMVERVVELFHEYESFLSQAPKGFHEALEHSRAATLGHIDAGFHSPELGLHVLTEEEIFGESKTRPARARPRSESLGSFVSDFRDLREGDYVVHLDHGIGKFQGLQEVGVGRDVSEFVIIEYAGGSKLYVPVDRLDLIQKHSSSGGAAPRIDRLGGTSWKKTKTRIKKSMRELAEDLIKLYARREVARGHAYSPDDELMREFEDAFEYEETTDQHKAIEACKKDLESPQPMDRLICGDVGYGKTEVAMRAAFKVVNDGKQVAVLSPTTVLAFQHFNTFQSRFSAFPVKIEMLSRFLTPKEQKSVVENSALGLVDILIGTHRLLSKDVKFADLGLIIVDEEQRFGVAHKERLKKLRAEVDVLTLSATPIPRTLNMSLAGIRDLSIIETAPKDRLAIQTALMKFSRKIIRSAIDLELKRQGQLFFLHNSVKTIYATADMIQQIMPQARVAVAHGQMPEQQLEKVMLDFLEYRYDVLVCTTIIENGLDIPRANTIMINQADRFGLSQLYQLRGRVGRSNRRAYAYLLISGEDTLTTEARKRLAAIKEFSDLGSGFRLAALDLEIRGAGNLLGGEQSGHIEAVGFELYVKLLEQAIRELQGEEIPEELHTKIDLRLDIHIPEHYIEDSNLRLSLYKRLTTAASPEKLAEMKEEIVDRFGRHPRAVSNLIEYSRLRLAAQELKIKVIERKGSQLRFSFREDTPLEPAPLLEMVANQPGMRLSPDGSLTQELDESQKNQVLETSFKILDLIASSQ